jgi:hypothetical protein
MPSCRLLILCGLLFLSLSAAMSRGSLAQDQPDTRARRVPTFEAVEERLLSAKILTERDLERWIGPPEGRTKNGERRWRVADCILLTATLGGEKPIISCWKREHE